jgi:hypothetical protein
MEKLGSGINIFPIRTVTLDIKMSRVADRIRIRVKSWIRIMIRSKVKNKIVVVAQNVAMDGRRRSKSRRRAFDSLQTSGCRFASL